VAVAALEVLVETPMDLLAAQVAFCFIIKIQTKGK
jgi:hypothetical protein